MKIAYFFIVILKSRILLLAGNENYLSEFRNTFFIGKHIFSTKGLYWIKKTK